MQFPQAGSLIAPGFFYAYLCRVYQVESIFFAVVYAGF
jgi:hypothetical protein